MRRFIACQNLERYRRLLATESNVERRTMLEQLLADEEGILAGLTNENDPDEPMDSPQRPKLS